MKLNVDLRYGIPVLISLIFVVLPSEDMPWNIQHDYLEFASLVLAVVILVFLFTSFNLPLTVEPIYLRTRHFSLSWTLLLLASLLLPPSRFWLLFPILVIISPWEGILLGLVWKFHYTLQALPARIILCFPESQEESEPPRPQGELIEVIIDQNGGEQQRRMKFNADLSYGIPVLISLIFVVLPSEDMPWNIQHDYLGFASLVLAVVILVFLFTSFNLPLTVEPIYLRTRHFSLSWTLSLLASLLLPPSRFWLLFPILVIISPWEGILLGLVWKFYYTLQALPARIILCFPESQEESEPPRPQGELIEVIIDQNGGEQQGMISPSN